MMTLAPKNKIRFLLSIWEIHRNCTYVFLAARHQKIWVEHSIIVDENLETNIRCFFQKHPAKKYDLYFCPNAFRSSKRKTHMATHTPYAWCDIDEADPDQFEPPPGILWETSPGRYQGLWTFSKRLRAAKSERISKYLTYEFYGDKGGWSITKLLRIPGTYNHKRKGKPPRVRLLKFDLSKVNSKRLLNAAPAVISSRSQVDGCDITSDMLDRDPDIVFRKHRRKILHAKARYLLGQKTKTEQDRSRQIFIMIAGLVEASVPWPDIACLLWHNPYFISKHDANIKALQAEIQRAKQKFNRKVKK